MQLDLALDPVRHPPDDAARPLNFSDLSVVLDSDPDLDAKIRAAVDVIKAQIQSGKRLIVACSFGKDSSVTLALTLMAMGELQREGIALPELHVMNSDTLLENPVVHAYSKGEIKALQAYAARHGLPVRMWVCSPSLSNNYLVNLIGGRTIASMPDNSAKCQQSLKAAPLERTKRKIQGLIRAELGALWSPETVITLVGTRRDESVVRARNMAKRGESALMPVNLDAEKDGQNWVLSPIADFTTMDVFEFMGSVTSGLIQTYSDFEALTEVYRDSAAGECMVSIFSAGKAQGRTACGARHGCWTCTRVQSDKSMENMLAEESGKYDWMRPLNEFRNYLKARHYDPKARNWLSRTVNQETGTIKISPNAYSPQFSLELLRLALSIDADEAQWSRQHGKPARFRLLTAKDILGIDLLWGRYAYQEPFTAIKEYLSIYEHGKRYRTPETLPAFDRRELDVRTSLEVPFMDEHYDDLFEGFRSDTYATANAESLVDKSGTLYADARVGDEFEIDEEAAELFFTFELEHALARYGPYSNVAPSTVVHHLVGLGTVQINKGGHSEWDRMLRVSNQIHRHRLQSVLHDPEALVSALMARHEEHHHAQLAAQERTASVTRYRAG